MNGIKNMETATVLTLKDQVVLSGTARCGRQRKHVERTAGRHALCDRL